MTQFFENFHTYEQPVELLIAAALFAWPLERRAKKPWLRCLGGLAALWVPCELLLAAARPYNTLFVIFLYVLLHSVTSFGTAALAVYLLREVRAETALYCATLGYVTQHMGYCLCSLIMPGNEASGLSFGQNLQYVAMVCAVYPAVYLLVHLWVVKPLLKNGHYGVGMRGTLAVMLVALGISLGLSLVVHVNAQPENLLYRCCLLYAIFCCALVLWSQVDLHGRLAQQHELDLQRQLWLRHKAQYERAKAGVALINHKCHELKCQIGAFEHLANTAQGEETRAAIREMEKTVSVYDSIVETGNEILNTILSEKSLQCAAQGITFTCVADGSAVDFVEAVDLFSMLGAALDNAVEAVQPLTDADKRAVSVSIFSGQGVSILQVENYFSGQLRFEDGLPATTKGDAAYYGFGLKSIRRTAEKYGGVLTVRAEDEIFLLRVTLPRDR